MKCIKSAIDDALQLLKADNNCFNKTLKSTGSACSSAELTQCISTYLNNATIDCHKGLPPFGFFAFTKSSACAKEKDDQRKYCLLGIATGLLSVFCSCKPCKDTNSLITLVHSARRQPGVPPGGPYDEKFIDQFCDPKNPKGKDSLIIMLIHEASHSCVGSHYSKDGGGARPYLPLTKEGVAYDPCLRPDPWDIHVRFARCHKLELKNKQLQTDWISDSVLRESVRTRETHY
jgi:hypothetical protein